MADIYDKVIELARRRGFVWPTSECYGSVAGFIDYGPLGAMLKRKIENVWRNFYVAREGYFEIECPTIGGEAIYIASGHVKGFADKMIQCPHCNEYHRADHVCDAHNIKNAETKSLDELTEILKDLPCPACGETFNGAQVHYFNLMFHTTIGPGSQRTGYLRPETAQGIFTDFTRLLRFYREKLPFGAVQIGKSYRNEISPRQGMIRLREFTQAEAEIFVNPNDKKHPNFGRYADRAVPLWGIEQQEKCTDPVSMTMKDAVSSGIIANEYVAYYVALTHDFLISCGAEPKKVRFRQHLPDERAHYATDCWDAEVFSERFGWIETVGIADRTNYDLNAHAKNSKDSFTVFMPYDEPKKVMERKIIPNMGALGPKYRNRAKAVSDALAESTPGENGAEIVLDGEKITIPPELYEIREQETEIQGEYIMPHVIEPSYGIDRILYCVLEHSYDEEDVDGEVRKVLHIPAKIAPVQVAVLPLMSRDGLDSIASKIMEKVQDEGIIAQYDDSGAIGRRYRRQDEVGTPFAVTVDYDTKEDNTVTLRERDSMKQIRCDAQKIPGILRDLIRGKVLFDELQ
ncbi:glycyl-tRNA synthetase [Methanomicrobium sp. W14]|uniref:glycine--tRNA ligase n=1 Tax=Methanomicrobium sp. W14 TaxID=2817839 RepID=UPI001AE1BD71|nr:glycine--tRNA ligase [Methanomicrobium sp. W14]MBP2132139.1 glycyl-tRNA synthetase [Methanomicrobium sp. W14]